MTKIDQLEGRELDAAVAEAHGWRPAVYSNHPFEMHPPGEDFEIRRVPPCHRNIAAAWELVKEMHGIGRRLMLEWNHMDHAGWAAVFYEKEEHGWSGPSAHADTAPTAISRAYLKAKANAS